MCSLCLTLVVSESTVLALQPARLLCPWDSPGKNAGVEYWTILQGSVLIQGLNLHSLMCLLLWKVDSLPCATWEAHQRDTKNQKGILQLHANKLDNLE